MEESLFCKNLGRLRFGLDRTILDIEFFHKNPDYFLSRRYHKTWRFYLRKLILNRIYSQFSDLSKKIIINEPEGITAAAIISKCLPKSKIMFMLPKKEYAVNSFAEEILQNKERILISILSSLDRKSALKISEIRWSKINEIINEVKNSSKSNHYIIKYEDWENNTSTEFQRILNFLEQK